MGVEDVEALAAQEQAQSPQAVNIPFGPAPERHVPDPGGVQGTGRDRVAAAGRAQPGLKAILWEVGGQADGKALRAAGAGCVVDHEEDARTRTGGTHGLG